MTDRVQKIREEVEKLKLCTMDEHMKFYSEAAEAEYNALYNIEHFIDSLEESAREDYEIYGSVAAVKALDRKRVCPQLKGNALHKFKNEFNTIKQIVHLLYDYEDPFCYRVALHWASWGAYNLKNFGNMNEKEKAKMDISEEPVSVELNEAAWQYYDRNKPLMPPKLDLHKELIDFFKAGARWKEQNDSNLSEVLDRDNLDEMAEEYSSCTYLEEVLGEGDREVLKARLNNTFKAGAKWQKENLWKLADGDDLPIIDREVIALLNNGKVVFAHRPPEFWDGKNIITGKVTRNYPKTYDKGGWNIPDVKFWLDVELPKEIEL